MGFKLKRAFKQVERPVQAVKRIGSAIVGMGKQPGGDQGPMGPQKYSIARSKAAGAGTVNFQEEGTY